MERSSPPSTSQAGVLHRLYSSLPLPNAKDYIRVLDLKSQTKKSRSSIEEGRFPNAELFGNIRVVDLNSHPEYTALSYVWGGEPEGRYRLRCNDYTMHLTRNCHAALSNILAIHGELTIWVDAICINQCDHPEKTKQIRIMGEIYSWAMKTYIWLGKGSPYLNRCIDVHNCSMGGYLFGTYGILPCRSLSRLRLWMLFMHPFPFLVKSFYATLRIYMPRYLLCGRLRSSALSETKMSWVARRLFGTADKYHFHDVLESDWTARLWTFQELILSSNPELVMGRRTVTCDQLLSILKEKHRHAPIPTTIRHWYEMMAIWENIERPLHWRGRRMRLTSLLESSPSQGLSGVKTTTFAAQRRLVRGHHGILAFGLLIVGTTAFILGLILLVSGVLSGLGCGCMSVLAILLTFPLGQIFTQAPVPWIGFLEQSSKMAPEAEVIRTIRMGKGRQAQDRSFAVQGILRSLGLPLTTLPPEAPLSMVYGSLFCDLLAWKSLNGLLDAGQPCFPEAPSWVPRYDLALHRPWISVRYTFQPAVFPISSKKCHVRLHGRKLRTNAAVVDEILRPVIKLKVEADERIAIRLAQLQITNMHRILELMWVMRHECGALADSLPLAQRFLQVVRAEMSTKSAIPVDEFNRWYCVVSEICTLRPSDSRASECLDIIGADPELVDIHKWIIGMLAEEERVVFITRHGRLGTASTFVQPGDKIVVIPTVAMPLVLRTVHDATDTFSVIGASFVAGMMDGEKRQSDELIRITLI